MFELAAGVLGVATAIIVSAAGGRWWAGSRRWRRFIGQVEAQHRALVEWGRARGWRVGEGTDLALLEQAERIAGLTGHPADWDLRPADEHREGERLKKWQFGTVLTHKTDHARIVLCGCWRDDEEGREHHVFASLTSQAVSPPFTMDLLDGGRTHAEGQGPPAEVGPTIASLLAEFGPPARLRLLADQLLISVPGWLPPDTADRLVEALSELHTRMPHRHQLGPMR